MAIRDYTVHQESFQLNRKCTFPVSGGKVGDPGLFGPRPGVLKTDQEADGTATMRFIGTHKFRVRAVNGGGNVAIAVGDRIYLNVAPGGSNPNLDAIATGVFFGIAATALASGTTGTVDVDFA